MKMSIRTKLIGGFVLVTLILLSVSSVIAYFSMKTVSEITVNLEHEVHELELAADLYLALEKALMPPNDYLITEDVKERDHFTFLAAQVEEKLAELEVVLPSNHIYPEHEEEEMAILEEVEKHYFKIKEMALELLNIEKPIGNEGASQVQETMDSTERIATEWLGRFLDIHYQEIRAVRNSIQTVRNRDIMKLLTVFFLAITIGLILNCLLSRNISKSITKLTEGTKLFGRGDLDHRLNIHTGDEIEELANSFNRMAAEIQQSRAELQASEEKYRGVVARASDIIYQIDVNGNFTFINPMAVKLTGYTEAELLGMNYRDLVHPEDAEELTKLYQASLRKRESVPYIEFRILTKSSRIVWIGQNNTVLTGGRKVTGWQSISRDITERKGAEVELRQYRDHLEEIVEKRTREIQVLAEFPQNNPNPVLRCSKKGEIIYMNPAMKLFKKEMGLEKCKNIKEIFPDSYDEIIDIIGTNKTIKDREINLNGRVLLLTCNSFPEEEKAFIFLHDITERKQAEEEIKRYTRELEKANRMKSEFLANMSHELRTPLNAVIGFSEILKDRTFGEINEKQADYLDHIHKSGKHLLDMINDILDLSKAEVGRMELEVEELSLPQLLDDMITIVKSPAFKKNIEIKIGVDEKLSTIKADEVKVKKIISILLDNAMKFTPDGGKINIKAALSENKVQISVSDTGIGIKPEDQERIFKGFEQVDASYAREYGGTGMGLALAKKLAELHGGEIWVESKIGKGSTFFLSIPLELKVHRKTILMADDDDEVRHLMKINLEREGFSVKTASDGEQTLNSISEQIPDLIVLDLKMPKIDGYEVLEKLKGNDKTSGIKVIAITGIDINSAEKLLSMGADEFLTKPFSKTVLISTIKRLLGIKTMG